MGAIVAGSGFITPKPSSAGASRSTAAVEEGRLPARFDRAFVDLWRYYLMYCEGGFRGGGIDVAQVTLTRIA